MARRREPALPPAPQSAEETMGWPEFYDRYYDPDEPVLHEPFHRGHDPFTVRALRAYRRARGDGWHLHIVDAPEFGPTARVVAGWSRHVEESR